MLKCGYDECVLTPVNCIELLFIKSSILMRFVWSIPLYRKTNIPFEFQTLTYGGTNSSQIHSVQIEAYND